ncbi:hypothetical protein SCOCK_760025 [Actinacidiphila cocklensis]|uniref:Uncharacterized protein n=1 Tax=Actinacidiphila cocklensis TaxID=887465 RepID=A0A9W4DZL6_9ACTN|nr:hypothetical protein SCOCK_760025 [Actinacidiphila cocklensis]
MAHQGVVAATQQRARQAFSLTGPPGNHLVVPACVEFHHPGDEFRRVLEVRVHEDHRLPPGHAQAGEHRGFLAEVPAEHRVPDAPGTGTEAVDDLPRAVGAAVVHVADLVVEARPSENLPDSRVEPLDDGSLVEARYDHGKLRSRQSRSPDRARRGGGGRRSLVGWSSLTGAEDAHRGIRPAFVGGGAQSHDYAPVDNPFGLVRRANGQGVAARRAVAGPHPHFGPYESPDRGPEAAQADDVRTRSARRTRGGRCAS